MIPLKQSVKKLGQRLDAAERKLEQAEQAGMSQNLVYAGPWRRFKKARSTSFAAIRAPLRAQSEHFKIPARWDESRDLETLKSLRRELGSLRLDILMTE